jgi:hypothetical protein
MAMTVRGHVTNGRLVVDVPTDLPEGSEVELVTVGDVVEVNAPTGERSASRAVDAMLARWRAQDLSAEPDWDVSAIQPISLRPHSP